MSVNRLIWSYDDANLIHFFLQYYRKTAQINIIIQFNGYKTII